MSLIIVLATLIFFPVSALSLNNLTPDDIILDDSLGVIYPLDEVVYLTNKLHDTSVSNPVIKLQSSPEQNHSSVGLILQKVPGLTLGLGRKNSLDLQIRGNNSQSTLVLLNGRPINSGYFGNVDLTMIPLNNLQEIQLEKGPSSVAYGPGGSGGVINFITNKNTGKNYHNYIFNISLSPGYETNTYFSYTRSLKKGSLFASIGRRHREAFRMSQSFDPVYLENGGNRDNSDMDEYFFLADYSHHFSDKLHAGLTLNGYTGNKGIPGSIFENQFWRYDDIKRIGSLLSWKYSANTRSTFLGSVFYNNYSDRLISYTDRDYNNKSTLFNSLIENYTYGFDLSHIYSWQVHDVHYGMKTQMDRTERSEDSTPYKINTYTLFTEDRIKNLIPGELTLGAGLHLRQSEQLSETDDYQYSASARYTKPISQKVSAHVALGRSLFFPTMHNLFSDEKGNPDLEAEEGYKAEIGFLTKLSFSNAFEAHTGLVLYSQKTENQIVLDPVSDRFKNLSELNSWGLEAQVQMNILERLDLNMNAGKIFWEEEDLTDYLEIPDLSASTTMVMTLSRKMSFMFSYIYNGKRNALSSLGSEVELKNYELMNASLSYRFPIWLTYTLTCENIQDVNYFSSYGYPAPGRMYWVKLEFDLSNSGK